MRDSGGTRWCDESKSKVQGSGCSIFAVAIQRGIGTAGTATVDDRELGLALGDVIVLTEICVSAVLFGHVNVDSEESVVVQKG